EAVRHDNRSWRCYSSRVAMEFALNHRWHLCGLWLLLGSMPCGSFCFSDVFRLRSNDLSDILLSRFDFLRSACVNRPVVRLLLLFGVRPVHNDFDTLQSDESATDHFVQLGKDLLDLFL